MACRELVKVQLVNCKPLSEMTSDGIPKRQTQWERKALVTVSVSMEARGMASSHWVSLSQMVSR